MRACVATLLATLASASLARAEAPLCEQGNVLAGRTPIESLSVTGDLASLTDGALVPDGAPWDTWRAVRFLGPGAHVTWDLGRSTPIRSAVVQGDNNDLYALAVSEDGTNFTAPWGAPAVPAPLGQAFRASTPFEARGRFVRVAMLQGDGVGSVTELQVYCSEAPPEPRPWLVRSTHRHDEGASHYRASLATKAASCLAAIAVIAALGRRRARRREGALALACALVFGAFAFPDFGSFHDGRKIHPTDAFHYFFGPKYFAEMGYFDFYTCLAAAEREAGRSARIESAYVRDLHDNHLHPGTWTRSPEGRCRARFTRERWAELRRDVALYLPNFPPAISFPRMLADHGYNGSPITTAWHRLFVAHLDARYAHVRAMTFMDVVSDVTAVLLLAWAFGPRAGVLAVFVIAFGEPWGYQWIGGTIGRATWVVCLAAGLAFARRGFRARSGVAFALSAALRLFPVVFAFALGLRALLRSARTRTIAREDRRMIGAMALGLAGAVLAAGLAVGFHSFVDWAKVIERHAATPPGNHLGLAVLVDFQPNTESAVLADARLADPLETWDATRHEIHAERIALTALGIAVALAALVIAIRRGASEVETVAMATPLLFSLLAITNYDGVWILALVPIVATSTKRSAWLLVFLAFTQLAALWFGSLEQRCTVQSLGLAVLLGAVAVDFLRELERRATGGDQPFATAGSLTSGSPAVSSPSSGRNAQMR